MMMAIAGLLEIEYNPVFLAALSAIIIVLVLVAREILVMSNRKGHPPKQEAPSLAYDDDKTVEDSKEDPYSTWVYDKTEFINSVHNNALNITLIINNAVENKSVSIQIDSRITVGRHNLQNDVFVNDSTVSGMQFELLNKNGDLFVNDLNSSNGTELNGRRITETEMLRSGDILKVGRTSITVVMQ